MRPQLLAHFLMNIGLIILVLKPCFCVLNDDCKRQSFLLILVLRFWLPLVIAVVEWWWWQSNLFLGIFRWWRQL